MSIPEIEKKNAREIKAFQGKALINMLQYVKKNSRFYQYHFRRHGINTDKIKNLDDLIHIPITRKEDLQSGADDFICYKFTDCFLGFKCITPNMRGQNNIR